MRPVTVKGRPMNIQDSVPSRLMLATVCDELRRFKDQPRVGDCDPIQNQRHHRRQPVQRVVPILIDEALQATILDARAMPLAALDRPELRPTSSRVHRRK